jgi:hypothetical protein
MSQKRVAIIGGNFDAHGGRQSGIIHLIGQQVPHEVLLNGGTFESLKDFVEKSIELFDAVIWMPNISNDEIKLVDRLKILNPHMVLVQSKRRVENYYTDFELVKRTFKSHAQLLIAIDRSPEPATLTFSLIDPLGNLWLDKGGVSELTETLRTRLEFLMSRRRVTSVQWDAGSGLSDEFMDVVKEMSDKFDQHITAVNPDRFLGNVSTRCCLGFPSTRLTGGKILVSRRNINKAEMTKSDFVEVWEGLDGTICYVGQHKPSVDAPIQLSLFRFLPEINFIFHGHCYVKGAPFTKSVNPCGSLDEVKEVLEVIDDEDVHRTCVNLRGHGCLIMSNRLDYIRTVELESRPFPEKHNNLTPA